MMTIKEYANSQNVSYEAIRKQVDRYRVELEGHIIKENKVQLLDDYAVEFLNLRRRDNPVIVYEKDRSAEEERLRKELDAVKTLLIQTQNQLVAAKDAEVQLIEARTRVQFLTEQAEKSDAAVTALEAQRADLLREVAQAQEQAKRLTDERDAAQAEAKSYTRTWFGLYKKA